MKHKAFILSAVSVLIVASAAILMSGDGKYIGKIGTIDTGENEIIVNVEGGNTVKMGEQLYVRIGKEVVIMEATFPMQIQVKCRLVKAGAKYFKSLETGMNVYMYDKAAIDDKSSDRKEPVYKTGRVEKFGIIEMVYIGGGTFTMGSPESEAGRSNDETPHRVTVSPFWIGKYEVTQKQYEDVMGTNPSFYKGDNLPVEQIRWYDAVEYCNKLSEEQGLQPYYSIGKNSKDPNNKNSYDSVKWTVTIAGGNGYRLPTEAEWEYACRGGTTTAFCYGDSIDSTMANFNGNNPYNAGKGTFREKTTAVGSFKPNTWMLYDMHGNVWEWCFDWYATYSGNAIDPRGADSGNNRVSRGGGWGDDGEGLRSACRFNGSPFGVFGSVGFRLVRSAY